MSFIVAVENFTGNCKKSEKIRKGGCFLWLTEKF